MGESNPHLLLPVGTQVVSLVEVRGPDGTAVHPRGAVGIVVQAPADYWHSYRVRFPDNFEAAFKRSELAVLSHFKQGEMTPAGGRLAEYSLFEHVIYRCVVGSRAYGLDGENSDTDRRGVYLPPAELHWSLYGVPDQLENDDTQEVYWELQKFLTLALKANPNVLECLYTPLVEHATPLAREMLDMRQAFVSRMVYPTYNGYVLSQFKKMQADLRNQGQVKWKHVMHLIRLLLAGITVLREGVVPVHVGDNRERLLAIKRGEIPWAELEAWRQELHRQFDAAAESTHLPERPDYERVNAFLLRARGVMVSAWEPGEKDIEPPATTRLQDLPQSCIKFSERLFEMAGIAVGRADWERLWLARHPPDVSFLDLKRFVQKRLDERRQSYGVTDRAILCVWCGYDVRGLAADSACPECGVSIVDGIVRTVISKILRVPADSIGSHSLLARDLGAEAPKTVQDE